MKPAKAILVPAIVVLLIDDTAACVGTTPALEYERYGFLLQAAQAGIDRAANACDFGGERRDQAKERRTHSRSSPTGGQSRKGTSGAGQGQ